MVGHMLYFTLVVICQGHMLCVGVHVACYMFAICLVVCHVACYVFMLGYYSYVLTYVSRRVSRHVLRYSRYDGVRFLFMRSS